MMQLDGRDVRVRGNACSVVCVSARVAMLGKANLSGIRDEGDS